MKKVLLNMLSVATMAVVMTGCGNKSTSNLNLEVDDSGIFGELPAIDAKYKDLGIDIMKEMMATSSKDEAGKQKLRELYAKAKEMEAPADEEFRAAYEKIKGTEIAAEVADDMPIKITSPFKFVKDDEVELGKVYLQGVAELTKSQPDNTAKDFFWFTYPKVVLVDGDGQPLLYVKPKNLMQDGFSHKEEGGKFDINVSISMEMWKDELLGKVKKIVLYSEKSDAYKDIVKTVNDTEKAFNKRLQQLLKGEAEGAEGEKKD